METSGRDAATEMGDTAFSGQQNDRQNIILIFGIPRPYLTSVRGGVKVVLRSIRTSTFSSVPRVVIALPPTRFFFAPPQIYPIANIIIILFRFIGVKILERNIRINFFFFLINWTITNNNNIVTHIGIINYITHTQGTNLARVGWS